MKKILLSTLVAASMGVIANDCTPADPVVTEPTLVYSVKMTVKTTKGLIGTATTDSSTVCTPGEVTTTATVIRLPDSTKFDGYIYDCTATCRTIADGSAVVWDSKRKAQLDGAAFTTTFINVIGKKQADAEWAWTFAGTATYDETRSQAYALTGAGLGKYSKAKGYYTSFSGNFAGTTGASYDLSKTASKLHVCDPSQVWQCDALDTLVDSDTVAYGTWTAKYNASASKKFASKGILSVPSYVTVGVE